MRRKRALATTVSALLVVVITPGLHLFGATSAAAAALGYDSPPYVAIKGLLGDQLVQ